MVGVCYPSALACYFQVNKVEDLEERIEKAILAFLFSPLNWELVFSGMVRADTAVCFLLGGVRALLQVDGMLSVRKGISERT